VMWTVSLNSPQAKNKKSTNQITLLQHKISGCHTGADEDSSFLEHNILLSNGKYLPFSIQLLLASRHGVIFQEA